MNLISKIVVCFLCVQVVIHAFCFGSEETKVLCVDIGGTRIKAAVMHLDISLEELQNVETISFSSREWLNEDLPLLFDEQVFGNLHDIVKTKCDELSIGIRGPVMDGTYCVVPKEHLPKEMKKKCMEASKRPVYLECDTGIWARGAIQWENLIRENIEFPCLGITLGTGIGVALIFDSKDVTNIEISVINSPFERLFELAKLQPLKQEYGRPAPHDAIGMPYFDWSQRERPFYDPELVNSEYNERVLAFVKDMEDYLVNLQGTEIKSIMIGGGNSRFIKYDEFKNKIDKQLILLSPDFVAKYSVSFDVISLLGCLMIRDNPPVKMMPSWDEMMPFYVE